MSTCNDGKVAKEVSKTASKAPSALPAKESTQSKALIETIGDIFASTAAPVQLASSDELANHGFSFTSPPYLQGHYSKFFRALKEQEHIIVKTLELNRMTPVYKRQTIEESCRILEYLGRKENVPNVVRVFGQFLVGADLLYVFMHNYTERSIHSKMRAAGRLRENQIRLFANQLGAVCKFMEGKGIVHRSIRLEHLLADEQDNLQLTGFTRAIFVLNPHNFEPNKCRRENRCRKRNHLPPECFSGVEHSPEHIDQWSFGVTIVCLFTKRHPFKPKQQSKGNFHEQWQAFVTKHGAMVNASVVLLLNRLFVMQKSDRLPLDELLKMDYFSKVEPQKEGKKKSPKRVSAFAPASH